MSPSSPTRYQVIVADNFHYQDEDAFTADGTFDTATDAIARCQQIVDASLAAEHKPGMTAAALYAAYQTFGDDPFIRTEDPAGRFSAWTYAKKRCAEIA